MSTNQPLRILLGPWDKSLEWLGQIEGADVICFGQDAPMPYQFHQDTMTDLFNRLPDGWKPDAFVFWQPHLYAVPNGWQSLNLPTFAVIVDWQLLGLLDGNIDWLRAFDGVFLDRGGVEFLQKQGFERVWPFLPSSFNPDLHQPDPTAERIYDISFAGALAHPIHRARSRWLYRVSKLVERYRIAFFDWTLGPEQYARIMQQSRIIFNHTYRGELNIRCFEAMAAGALLFLEEGNPDAVGHFEDGVHYVSYNETNYQEKLDYYLSHEAERQQIAEAGWWQVQQHTNTAHLNWLVKQIKPLLAQPSQAQRTAWTPRQHGLNHIINFYAPITPVRAKAAQQAWEAARASGDDPAWLETALAAVEFGLAKKQSGAEQVASTENIIRHLQEAIRLQPDWAWPRYNLGQLLMMVGQKEQAVQVIQATIEKLQQVPVRAAVQFGPYLPYDYDHFMVAWLETNVHLGWMQGDRTDAWAALLEARCQEILGKIYSEQRQLHLAKAAFQRAIELRPDIGAFHFLFAEVAAQSGQHNEALAAAKKAMQIDAMDVKAWLLVARSMYQTQAYADCVQFCDEQLMALNAFPNFQVATAPFQELRQQAQQAIVSQGNGDSTKIKPSSAPQYYQFPRPEVQALVPLTARRILDVGCAGGALGQGLKARQNCEVTGIEYVPEVAQIARGVLDKVYDGDINKIAPTLPRNYFDVIIFADVLEHLPDPAAVLTALLPTLAEGGRFVVSIPNVRHWSVVKGLLEGRWDYEEAGLLDRTHLRFFTRNSFEKLLNQVGLQPVSVGATSVRYETVPAPVLGALKNAGLNVASLEQESQVYQWLYVAEPIPPMVNDILATTSIIILTHNQVEQTLLCLESIEAHTPEPHELIIVDNASTDETLDYLRRYQATHSNVRVVANPENLGFAAGNNQGLALAQGDFVLLLNNDTIVTPGWLGRMLAVFRRYPEVGLVGPMSNYVSGPQLVKNATYQNLEEMTQFAIAWTAAHAGQSMEFFRIVGFCLLARREVIDRIGGLDERFGSGNFEDDDICLRAAIAGFKARIVQDVFIHHTGGQTFKAAGIDYRQSLDRNWDLFKRKWNLPANLPYGGDYRPYLVASSTIGYIPLPTPANIPLQQRSQAVEGVTVMLLADEAQPEQTTICLEHLERYRPTEQNIVVKVVNAPASLPSIPLKVVKSSESSALEALKVALSLPTKYVLLLSADVLVTEKWLDTLLAVAESNPAVAAVGPMANAAPAAQRLEPGYTDLTELPAFSIALADQYQAKWDEVLYLGGFCTLLKTHTTRVVGGLNETLPLPDALLDLYGRLRNFGFKRVCARGVYVHHYQLSAAEGADYDALAAYHQKVNSALTPGQVAMAQNDLETAAYEFARAAEQYPDLAPVHRALSSALLTLGQTEAAIPSLRQAVELTPQDMDLRRQLAQILYQLGQSAEAEEILKQVQVIQPSDIETRLILVHLYREQGRYTEAVAEMKQVLSLDPNSADVLVASGLLLLDLNELAAAELTWSQLKDVSPTHPGVLVFLTALVQSGSTQIGLAEILQQVEALQMANQWPQAVGLLQTILQSSSVSILLPDEQAVLWNRLGYCYFKQNQLAEAEAAFTQGLTLASNDLDLLNNLAELYLQRAEYDLATEHINRALTVAPQNADTLLLLANVSVQLGVYDVALMAFQQVKELAPDTPSIDDIIKELSNLEDLSLTDNVNNGEPKVELSDLLEQADTAQAAEDWLQAVAVLQQAIQIASLTPTADEVMLWNRLGSCHYMAGQLPEAEAAFLQSLDIDPNSVAALNNLADFYTQEEQYDLATGYLTRALTLAPDDVGVLLSLGNCSIQLGVFDTALLAFQKVKQLAPETAGVEDVLAQLAQLETA